MPRATLNRTSRSWSDHWAVWRYTPNGSRFSSPNPTRRGLVCAARVPLYSGTALTANGRIWRCRISRRRHASRRSTASRPRSAVVPASVSTRSRLNAWKFRLIKSRRSPQRPSFSHRRGFMRMCSGGMWAMLMYRPAGITEQQCRRNSWKCGGWIMRRLSASWRTRGICKSNRQLFYLDRNYQGTHWHVKIGSIVRLIDWLPVKDWVDCSIDWLITYEGLSRLIDWLIDCLWRIESIDWLIGCFVGHNCFHFSYIFVCRTVVKWVPTTALTFAYSADQLIRLYNIENSKNLRTLRGHTAAIQQLTFADAGKNLFSASHDGELSLSRKKKCLPTYFASTFACSVSKKDVIFKKNFWTDNGDVFKNLEPFWIIIQTFLKNS